MKTRNTGIWFVLNRNDHNCNNAVRSDPEKLQSYGCARDNVRLEESKPSSMRTSDSATIESCVSGSCRVKYQEPGFTADKHESLRLTTRRFTNSRIMSSFVHNDSTVTVEAASDRHCKSCVMCFVEPDLNLCDETIPKANAHISSAISSSFWRMPLFFHSYIAGDFHSPTQLLVEFASLWPSSEQLDTVIPDFCRTIPGSIEVLCNIAISAQVQQILVALLKHNIVGVNQQICDGIELLHMACLARNVDAVEYLVSAGATMTLQDSPEDVTLALKSSTKLSDLVPSITGSEEAIKVCDQSAMVDKQTVFNLAICSSNSSKLLLQLQLLNFAVNSEMNCAGDFLVHVLIKSGISQLPILILLVRRFEADINRCNVDGLTCLMLAASLGDCLLTDLLVCVLGANIDGKNPQNGWSALHYGCYEKHVDVVKTLLKRGANFDVEDNRGVRPDELAASCQSFECGELVVQARRQHINDLKNLVKTDDLVSPHLLRRSDQFAVDDDGFTLIMMASMMGSFQTLKFLLEQKDAPVNAQHIKNLQTALAFAAIAGHSSLVQLLLENGANPSIDDKENMLPLHHAVRRNDISTVQTLLQYLAALTGLVRAKKMTTDKTIQALLTSATERRQKEILAPQLFDLVSSGDVSGLYCLLEDGDDVNSINDVGDWPMCLAVRNGNCEMVKLLYQWNGDITSQQPNDGDGTVLHSCCFIGNVAIAEFLLVEYKKQEKNLLDIYNDMPVNLLNAAGFTPLMLAADQGHMDLVKLLLDNGASTSVLGPSGDLYSCLCSVSIQNMLDDHHRNHARQIFDAVSDKRAGLKKLKHIFLAKHDHNVRDSLTGDSPLMQACFHGRIDVMKFLLESTSYTLIHKNNARLAPMSDQAVAKGGNIATDSLSSGVFDLRMPPPDLDDDTYDENLAALVESMYSVCANNPVINGGQANHIFATSLKDGCTAYHRAVESGDHVSVIACLLSADESAVNAPNTMGLSPLHVACKLNRSRIVKKLLTLPFVDLNCRTLDGQLPEDLISNKSLVKVIKEARGETKVSHRKSWFGSYGDLVSSTGEASFADFSQTTDQYLLFKQQQTSYMVSSGFAMFN